MIRRDFGLMLLCARQRRLVITFASTVATLVAIGACSTEVAAIVTSSPLNSMPQKANAAGKIVVLKPSVHSGENVVLLNGIDRSIGWPGDAKDEALLGGRPGLGAKPLEVSERRDWGGSQDNAAGFSSALHLIHARPGSLADAFANCPGRSTPSDMCVVVVDPGRTYTVSSALIIGSETNPQTLLCMGGTIKCTGTGGAGHACLVIADKGHLKAPTGGGAVAAGQGCQVTADSTTNIDSLVESYAGYAYSALREKVQQVNFDVENISIVPNPMMAGLEKAALWVSAIDGDAWVSNIYVGPGPIGSTGVLIDDAPTGSAYGRMYWNNLNFNDVWVGMGNEAYAVKVRCGATTGSSGANLTWTGGAMVDGTNGANVAEFSADGGISGACIGVLLQNIYFESKTGQAGDYIELKGVSSFVAHSLIFNGGPPLTNCISISGAPSDQIHADGRAMSGPRCTSVIHNTATSPPYIDAVPGAFNYDWSMTGSQPIKQIGGLLNPFGPGGQGTYYADVSSCKGSETPAPCCTGLRRGPACVTLPTCSSNYARYMVCAGDSAQCKSGTTYSSSSNGVGCLLQCNNAGNAWKETGVSCF
jgi:hypothetical protein